METNIKEITKAILDSKAQWVASENPIAQKAKADPKSLLGCVPEGDISFEELETTLKARAQEVAVSVEEVGYPASYDLRNVGGQNFITQIRNQLGCGSCVAFGTCATVEGTFRVQRNNPNLPIDLSEAHLFYCIARNQGRNCSNGWWPEPALDAFRDIGVADEACYPYTGVDQNCTNLCADWQSRVTKITAYHALTSNLAGIKQWISTRGPVSACFYVYNDFFSYTTGIYKHVTGALAGGHCVSIVGYNDAQGYWICKNSWGTGWGESGFFRIAYGDCFIDTWKNHAVDGIVETGWIRDNRVLGLWTINQDRNAWAYLSNVPGWRKIWSASDNIFFDMLAQLAAAKASNRRVDIRQENGIIVEIYVL
jgi:C1A family cysteine protease